MTQQMGRFPKLGEYRAALGLEVSDLAGNLSSGPKEKSIRRLEQGLPIRLASVYRVLEAINRARSSRGMDALSNRVVIAEK